MRMRTALVLAVLAGLSLTGCSTSDDASGPTSDGSPSMSVEDSMAAFVKCMREHGIDMPDAEINGDGGVGISIPQGTDPEAVDAATQACKQYQPNGGEPEKLSPELMEKNRAYAKCMREHGLPDFPDPDPDTGGISLNGNQFMPDNPDFKAADKACGGPGGSTHVQEEK